MPSQPFHHNDGSESDDCYGKDPDDDDVDLLPPLAHKHGHPQLRPGKKEKDLEYNHDRQIMERIQIQNFQGPVLMNRRSEMGGVRVERMQYRRWGGE